MKKLHILRQIPLILLFILVPFSIARAYVGPGVGITMIWAFWIFIGIILVSVGGLLVWPIRYLRRRLGRKIEEKKEQNAENG